MPPRRAIRRIPAKSSSQRRARRKSPSRGRAGKKSPSRGRAGKKSPSRGRARRKSPSRGRARGRATSRGKSRTRSASRSYSGPSYYSRPSYPVAAEPFTFSRPELPRFKKPTPTEPYEGVVKGKFRYRSKSPTRKRGEYGRNDPWKNITWLAYMVESGYFGKNTVCLGSSGIHYDARERKFINNAEAVFWSIVDCPNKIVIVDITVVLGDGPTHANVLIVNKARPFWEIERFEPHGMVEQRESYGEGNMLYTMQERIDEDFKAWFTKVLGGLKQPFVYKRPIDVCPRRGPQSRSEEFEYLGGFCQTWTLLYVDARLSHPEMTSEELLSTFFELPAKELYEMIQDYVHFVKETQVPEEFEKYLTQKRLMIIGYEMNMTKWRQISLLTEPQLDEVSHDWYRVISKFPVDTITVESWNNVDTFIAMMLERTTNFDTYVKLVRPLLVAFEGKRLMPDQFLKDQIRKYREYVKEDSHLAAKLARDPLVSELALANVQEASKALESIKQILKQWNE